MEEAKRANGGKRLQISPTMAKAMLPDIEDGLKKGRL